MEFFSLDILEKLLSPKDLITVGFIWFLIRGRVASHFRTIESSLSTIGGNIENLNKSILELERSQTKKINDLTFRVNKLEGQIDLV